MILDLIKTTTEVIRSVQKYCVALPADAFASTCTNRIATAPDRYSSTEISDFVKAATIMQGSSASVDNQISSPESPPSSNPPSVPSSIDPTSLDSDPLLFLRKSSIEVLTTLKSLETKYRLYTSSSLVSTPTNQETNSQLFDLDRDAEEEGEESLSDVVFRTDVALEDLLEESEIIHRYISLIEKVLFRNNGPTNRKSNKLSQDGDSVPPRIVEGLKTSTGEGLERKRGTLGHRRSAKIDSVALEEFVAGEEILIELGVDSGGRKSIEEEEEELPDWATNESMNLLRQSIFFPV